jgi:glycine/D-amino acid oxidase-like deaminating enzyme/nitrite reductase/ring-hydroxylating ferredoxin subunit
MQTPYWIDGVTLPAFRAADGALRTDAVVVGGGITGATAAYLLKQAGLSVILVERDRCGSGDTAHTSAHLTAVTDVQLTTLLKSYGRAQAEAIWDGGFAAIHQIASNVNHLDIRCDFQFVPAFLTGRIHASEAADRDQLSDNATAAADLGFDARLVESAPGVRRPGVRFDHQARFRPMEYLDALLRAIDGDGSHVFEHSGVTTVDDEPLVVHTDKARISTSLVVVATHVPILGKASMAKGTLLQTDLYPYSSYVVSARVPKQSWPDALIFDLSDPYYFFRLDPGDTHDMLIAGGCDHKTGQTTDTHKPLEQLRAVVQQLVPTAEITHQWTGQVIETRDRLPYIGEVAKGQFAITGFGGNGITFGTLGAMMARDHATGRTNPWTGLFDINRTLLTDGLWHYVRENSDYPYHMVRDRVAGADGDDLRSVPPGEGRIIDVRGNRVAAYRRESGTLSLMSPICPHMGCVVNWNAADSTWDCPCHGSRFSPTGRVLRGPAESDLSSHQE